MKKGQTHSRGALVTGGRSWGGWPVWIKLTLVTIAVLLGAGVVLMAVMEQGAPDAAHYDYWREMLISTSIIGPLGGVILAAMASPSRRSQ